MAGKTDFTTEEWAKLIEGAMLAGIAERVANASTEGGFLGFGGERMSEHEKATLADLAKALNI